MPSEIHFFRGMTPSRCRVEENMDFVPAFLSSSLSPLMLSRARLKLALGMAFSMVFGVFIGVTFLATAGSAQSAAAQAGQTIRGQTRGRQIEAPKESAPQARGPDGGELEVLHVQGNVSLLAGAGGN